MVRLKERDIDVEARTWMERCCDVEVELMMLRLK
jgi:hypothetical protein